jgi:glycosyltransferase involved in cell wall biosynthesis
LEKTEEQNNLKIAMFGQKAVPSREGGIEIVVGELAARLASFGNDVTIYNRKRKHDKNHPKLKEYQGCHLQDVFTINTKGLDALLSSFFATVKAKHGHYDVIHVHAEGPCAFLWMLGKHKHTKVVVTIHGLDWQRGKWGGFASWFIRHGEKEAVKHADEIIVLSKDNQDYFENTYHRKTTLIPNGVSEPTLREPELITKNYGLSKGSYVLFLARIVPEKGLHYLIDAWQGMTPEEKKGKKLVIAGGDSHATDYYNSIINKVKGDGSILMTGFVEGQLLEELYSNAYLYVLPSDIEGMPMSLLEAMSFGNLCLVSNIPQNLQVLPKSGFFFKKGDSQDLKNQLVKILSSSLTSHTEKVIPYRWEDVAKETLKIYERERS